MTTVLSFILFLTWFNKGSIVFVFKTGARWTIDKSNAAIIIVHKNRVKSLLLIISKIKLAVAIVINKTPFNFPIKIKKARFDIFSFKLVGKKCCMLNKTKPIINHKIQFRNEAI